MCVLCSLQRIVAPHGHRQRSRLSVMVQHLCGVKWGHTLPGSVFVPQPDVSHCTKLIAAGGSTYVAPHTCTLCQPVLIASTYL